MANTSIAWTDKTWNPVRGCSMAKGSENGGCLNCYAARMASRSLPGLKSPTTGKSFARILPSGPRWTGDVELIESKLSEPLHWKKPCRIFVNSMSDLFHEALTDEMIDQVFTAMVAADWHTYQILTKRPERMLKYFRSGRHDHGCGPDRADYHLDQNIWLGVSVEDRQRKYRIAQLSEMPAALGRKSFAAQDSSGLGQIWKTVKNVYVTS